VVAAPVRELVADLTRLVAFETVSDRALDELADFVAGRCEGLGFRVERYADPIQAGKSSLVATIGPDTGGSGLMLSGHMDVVPTEGQPWTSDPFRVVERGGNLYGRGTADMKGFFAATLQALARIPRGAWNRECVLVWTHDEEVGCLGSAQLARRLAGRPLPTACLIGEPTDFRVLRMHPGHVAVEVAITGRAAHSSRPHLGINAIDVAADVIHAVRGIARELEAEHGIGGESPAVPVNVARIHGGTAVNIVPDHCVLELGYRPPPGMAAEHVFERIRDRLGDLRTPAGVEVRLLRVTPSLLTPEGTPLESLLAPYASAPGTGTAPFATDGGNLAKLGIQPLVFGPGSIEVAHQADEHVAIDALVRAVDVVEAVVRARCCSPR
jgi:acetylornithine deacetylase